MNTTNNQQTSANVHVNFSSNPPRNGCTATHRNLPNAKSCELAHEGAKVCCWWCAVGGLFHQNCPTIPV
eukprot:9888940-Alexandrium_andersonii.AAC.1